ncbi:replicative DNA helicase [Rhodospirillum rubrum]|uniref:Replicative DNA helicase n=2 Tax=Rhodospirillum rubrum TaxID=1085 RepID=Q2RXD0_RHORT|nr:replicative DNA helicase [Rhodospirillum rubrum]ABC21215.1 DnaB helicase [Rhodospirillum rubrum ATCC 11170]AEO46890.1 replicative DNA helicase [Rhodospirillum rubrum F11]MBK5952767.1 replicative DNA helicase [Rhodospirillum rubrum]QXG80905.1 replicative DNA helicase [Rhodospirillum rubrum]
MTGHFLAAQNDPSAGPAAEATRLPPANIEAEQALLGAILTNNRVLEKVGDFLRPAHFSHPAHGAIYEACVTLTERGHLANPVTLAPYLDHRTELEEVGGARYLAQLVNAVVTIINAEDYGTLVHDLFLRRELIALGSDLVNDAFEADLDSSAVDQIEGAERKLFDLATTGQTEGGLKSFKDSLIGAIDMAEKAHKREGQLAGVPSLLVDLDKKLGGLHDSDLLILAGRPSMGKTALATTIAFNAATFFRQEAQAGEPSKAVAFFSLEMSAEQLATRILSERAEVSSHRLRTGELANEDFDRVLQVATQLHSIPLFIDDTPALSVGAMRTRCRRLARSHGGGGNGLGLIVVDYLQLLQGGKGERSENRVQEVSAITRGLKALAKELNVPVMALSQLSRQVESRDDKRPQLSDLRESGSIEQDADVVMFVFREQYYLERAEPLRKPDETDDRYQERHLSWIKRCEDAYNKAEVIIAKQRHGPIGSVSLFFDGNYTRFGNLQGGEPPPDL